MNKKIRTKKLDLAKTTLRALSPEELEGAAGGTLTNTILTLTKKPTFILCPPPTTIITTTQPQSRNSYCCYLP